MVHEDTIKEINPNLRIISNIDIIIIIHFLNRVKLVIDKTIKLLRKITNPKAWVKEARSPVIKRTSKSFVFILLLLVIL